MWNTRPYALDGARYPETFMPPGIFDQQQVLCCAFTLLVDCVPAYALQELFSSDFAGPRESNRRQNKLIGDTKKAHHLFDELREIVGHLGVVVHHANRSSVWPLRCPVLVSHRRQQ